MTKQIDVDLTGAVAINTEITSGAGIQTEITSGPSIRAEILKNSEIVTSIQSEPIVTVNLSHGGQRGYSAYEIWLQEGNTGSVQDYLDSLRGAGAESYVHEQIQAQSEWTVKHWLRKFPSVTIVDSGENVVVGDIDYLDEDTVTLRFTAAFGGKAYLN